MVRQSQGRPGFTLTEVLMAMFVMAIGMISLLALFPAAFQQAKWALDNEQVARAAANAQSTTELPHMAVSHQAGQFPFVGVTMQNVRNDSLYKPALNNQNLVWCQICSLPPGTVSSRLTRDFFLFNSSGGTNRWTFNADISLSGTSLVDPTLIPNARVKLPPVFVDPRVARNFFDPILNLPFHVGADNSAGPYDPTHAPFRFNAINSNPTVPQVVGAPGLRPNWSLGIPRFSLSQYGVDPFDPNDLRMQRETSMGDEIDFDVNGQPRVNTALQFARQNRFTWAYMCQWPDYKNPDLCEVTAVVFNSRPDTRGLSNFPAGETTYANPLNTLMFSKGLTQALIVLPATSGLQPISAKVGDWILDSTFILPEYDPNFPDEVAPFLDRYSPAVGAVMAFPQPAPNPPHLLRPGLVGGHFYKILDISAVQGTSPNFFQTITLDRPARSDGFNGTLLSGVSDVITKSVGRMPQR